MAHCGDVTSIDRSARTKSAPRPQCRHCNEMHASPAHCCLPHRHDAPHTCANFVRNSWKPSRADVTSNARRAATEIGAGSSREIRTAVGGWQTHQTSIVALFIGLHQSTASHATHTTSHNPKKAVLILILIRLCLLNAFIGGKRKIYYTKTPTVYTVARTR